MVHYTSTPGQPRHHDAIVRLFVPSRDEEARLTFASIFRHNEISVWPIVLLINKLQRCFSTVPKSLYLINVAKSFK